MIQLAYEKQGDQAIFHGDKDYQTLTSTAVKQYPYNCIGIIYQDLNGQIQAVGTGFLIASDLVVTVAHNIYSTKEHIYRKSLLFFPGVSGDLSKNNACKVRDFRIPQQYLKGKDSKKTIQFDYALLKLDRKVQREKYIELGLNYIFQKEEVKVIGYRGLNCSKSTAIQSQSWRANDHIAQGKLLSHKISTISGNSGSPIMIKRRNKLVAIGIHKGSPSSKDVNQARLITNDVLQKFICWQLEMRQFVSQIKFCELQDSTSKIIEEQAAGWLENSKKQLQCPEQQKIIQIRQKSLCDIVKKFQTISDSKKSKIISLKLKCRRMRGYIKDVDMSVGSVFMNLFSCNILLTKCNMLIKQMQV